MDFFYTAAILRMAINMAALTDKGRAEAERALNELLMLAQAKAGALKNPQPDPCADRSQLSALSKITTP